jgi:hypothetical protein
LFEIFWIPSFCPTFSSARKIVFFFGGWCYLAVKLKEKKVTFIETGMFLLLDNTAASPVDLMQAAIK